MAGILLATLVLKPFLPHQFGSVHFHCWQLASKRNPAEESKLKGDLRMTVSVKQAANLEQQIFKFQVYTLQRGTDRATSLLNFFYLGLQSAHNSV